MRQTGSTDYFYHIFDRRRPWIAAVGADGLGLGQSSTALLRGRKCFLWGQGTGGRNWQRFLSGLSEGHMPPTTGAARAAGCEAAEGYIEIQAGLGRTQNEYLRMPAHARWSWTETYGLFQANAANVHGADWSAARREGARQIENLAPAVWLDQEHQKLEAVSQRPSTELLCRGAGWGALERRRRQRAGQPPFCGSHLDFPDDTLGSAQAPWLALLESGRLPAGNADEPPAGFMIDEPWRILLEHSLTQPAHDNWLARLHLGVMHYHAGRIEPAAQAWRRSLELVPSAWAMRNLAVVAEHEGRGRRPVPPSPRPAPGCSSPGR
jgi:hypothetical protein